MWPFRTRHDRRIDDLVRAANQQTRAILYLAGKVKNFMAIRAETQDVLDSLNQAATAIEAKIDRLTASSEQTPEEKVAFGDVIRRLNALASDPIDPVPSEPELQP